MVRLRYLLVMALGLALLGSCREQRSEGPGNDLAPSSSPLPPANVNETSPTSVPLTSPTPITPGQAPEASMTAVVPNPPLPTAAPPREGTTRAPEAELVETVFVYLIEPGTGDLGCNDTLMPVARQVKPTLTPVPAAISELLSLDQQSIGQPALYNALSQSNLAIESVTVDEQGQATIRLTGVLRLSGICDAPRVRAQLMNTVLQFTTVQAVDIYVNGELLNRSLSLHPDPPSFEEVTIYLIAEGEGELGCGDRLVPIKREVASTPAPLTAAIRELLELDERTLGQAELYNPLYQSQLEIDSVRITSEGAADIRLVGDFKIGGVCDAPRVGAMLRSTALQFQTVRSVNIFINDEPLAALLSERGR